MEVIKVENGQCDINSYCPDVEGEALSQMKEMCLLPFTRYASLMPDAHTGQKKGLPIGGVLATKDVILPTGCGIDLGCGMGVIRTSIHKSEMEDVNLQKKLHHSFERAIPTGFMHNSEKRIDEIEDGSAHKIDEIIKKSKIEDFEKVHNPVGNYRKEFASQCSTLGGG